MDNFASGVRDAVAGGAADIVAAVVVVVVVVVVAVWRVPEALAEDTRPLEQQASTSNPS